MYLSYANSIETKKIGSNFEKIKYNWRNNLEKDGVQIQMDHDPKIIRSLANNFNQAGKVQNLKKFKYQIEALQVDTHRGSFTEKVLEIGYKRNTNGSPQENHEQTSQRKVASNKVLIPVMMSSHISSADASFLKTDCPTTSSKRVSVPALNLVRISSASPTPVKENIPPKTTRDQLLGDGLVRLCESNGLKVPKSARISHKEPFSKMDKRIDTINTAKMRGNSMIRSNPLSPEQIKRLLKKNFLDGRIASLSKYRENTSEEIHEKNKEFLNKIRLVKMLRLDKLAAEGGFPLLSTKNTPIEIPMKIQPFAKHKDLF